MRLIERFGPSSAQRRGRTRRFRPSSAIPEGRRIGQRDLDRTSRSDNPQISLGAIIALAQQRCVGERCRGVGETVPRVQARGMAALTEATPSRNGDLSVCFIDGGEPIHGACDHS